MPTSFSSLPLMNFTAIRSEEKNSDEDNDDSINTIININSDNDNTNSNDSNVLRRSLSLYDGFSVLVGIMVGSGIFASPGVALERSGSSGLFLLAWLGAGGLVYCSALSYMELAALMPSAGGDFSFLKRAYGDNAAFIFAWYNFWISKTGSQAIIATVFGEYITWILGIENNIPISKLFAVLLTILLAVINCAGIRESADLQNILTMIKIGLVIFLFISAIIYLIIFSPTVLMNNFSNGKSFDNSNSFGYFTAMVAALWAFDGWADLNFLAEELHDPSRNIPRVMTIGISTVTLIYILANISYLIVLSSDDIKNTNAIAIDFGYSTGGKNKNSGIVLATILAAGVAIATAGSDNGSIMTGGRAFFAVARDGFAPRYFSKLNASGAPYAALIAQCIWTCVLLLLPGSSFATLLDYFGPISWCFYAWTASSVIKLRIDEPNLIRPFLVPWYPLPPLITCFTAIMIMISSLSNGNAFYTILAIIFCAMALPLRLFFKKYLSFLMNNNNDNSNNDGDDSHNGDKDDYIETEVETTNNPLH